MGDLPWFYRHHLQSADVSERILASLTGYCQARNRTKQKSHQLISLKPYCEDPVVTKTLQADRCGEMQPVMTEMSPPSNPCYWLH
jgi:hypothetical protein